MRESARENNGFCGTSEGREVSQATGGVLIWMNYPTEGANTYSGSATRPEAKRRLKPSKAATCSDAAGILMDLKTKAC